MAPPGGSIRKPLSSEAVPITSRLAAALRRRGRRAVTLGRHPVWTLAACGRLLRRTWWARLHRTGLVASLRHLRDSPSPDERAALYRRWISLNTPTAEDLARLAAEVESLAYHPRISIVTPVYDTDPTWLTACIESVLRQAYPDWELCLCDDGSRSKATQGVLRQYEADPRIHVTYLASNGGISAASNAALATATGEFVAFLDHDDELSADALHEIVRCLNEHPDADMIYSDEDKIDPTGERCDPYFKPDWSPELFLSCMYTCHLMAVRASLIKDLGGFRLGYEGAQDYDLVLRLMERTSRIHHIPKILYHWRKLERSVASSGTAKPWALDAGERALQDYATRMNLDATVSAGSGAGLYRVRYRIVGRPLVSIVIPTAGGAIQVGGQRKDLLVSCIRSVVEKTAYENYELIVADDGWLPASMLAFLETVPHKRVSYRDPGPFNYARKLNFAVSHAKGTQLILFNDDLEVMSGEWLTAMLEHSQREPVGAVGAKLFYPDGRLQHIGIVMGVCGMAAHAFHRHPGSSQGYGASAVVVRDYSAVTAACMMTRRDLYDRLGGFNERFALDFNDTDYCLRLRAAGYRVVFTPYAQLYHWESATAGPRAWRAEDVDEMRRTWGDVCERDPYYNPNLTRDFPDYRVRVEGYPLP